MTNPVKEAPPVFSFPRVATIDTPDADYVNLAIKDSDGMAYIKDEAGVETPLGGSTTDINADTLTLNDGSTLTIASGAITVTHSRHMVDTEASAASDDLDTVNGLAAGEICLIMAESGSRTVVVKHGTGNIDCLGFQDLSLNDAVKAVLAIGNDNGTDVWALPIGWNPFKFQMDSGPPITVDTGDTVAVVGGTGIDTSSTLGNINILVDSTVTRNDVVQTLTNKTIDADDNTLLNYEYVADGIVFNDPTAQTWTNLNHGGGTYTEDTTNKRLYIVEDGDGTIDIRGYYMTAPATPYTVTAHIRYFLPVGTTNGIVIFFRQDSTTELSSIRVLSGGSILVDKFNSPTSANSTYASSTINNYPEWFRITDNGTNRIYQVSNDGIAWVTLHTVGRTDFLTADGIGFGVALTTNATFDTQASLLSWEIT